ncbi:hypothetical protein ACE02D_16340 [Shewanella bicestrii]
MAMNIKKYTISRFALGQKAFRQMNSSMVVKIGIVATVTVGVHCGVIDRIGFVGGVCGDVDGD